MDLLFAEATFPHLFSSAFPVSLSLGWCSFRGSGHIHTVYLEDVLRNIQPNCAHLHSCTSFPAAVSSQRGRRVHTIRSGQLQRFDKGAWAYEWSGSSPDLPQFRPVRSAGSIYGPGFYCNDNRRTDWKDCVHISGLEVEGRHPRALMESALFLL